MRTSDDSLRHLDPLLLDAHIKIRRLKARDPAPLLLDHHPHDRSYDWTLRHRATCLIWPMESLPIEIVIQILTYGLAVHPVPSSILRVASHWRDIGQTILHTHIEISSLTQLYLFRTSKLSCKPRSFALRLVGGAVDFTRQSPTLWTAPLDESVEVHNEDIRNRVSMSGGIFGCLRFAFFRCPDVEEVHLRLNSHTSDPHIEMIHSALCLVKYVSSRSTDSASLILRSPRKFEWTGPDPEHHWSTAVRRGEFLPYYARWLISPFTDCLPSR